MKKLNIIQLQLSKNDIYDILFRLFIVLVTNVLLSVATIVFLTPAHLYAGGATGIAQLVQGIIRLCGGNMNLGILIFIVNVPIALIGARFVSKKFAIYSVVAIIIQSLTTGLLEQFAFSPFEALAKPIETINGPIMNYGGILTLAIFGGLLAGLASGLALRFGVSTGGIDVISQALALHKNFSLGNITMIINVLIAIIGGGIIQSGNWIVVLFTIVRMILNSLVMDKVHTSYTYTALHIYSDMALEISNHINRELRRGTTLYEAVGGYTHNHKQEIYCVVSHYEVERVTKIVESYDPKAFVTITPVSGIKGRFIKKTIV